MKLTSTQNVKDNTDNTVVIPLNNIDIMLNARIVEHNGLTDKTQQKNNCVGLHDYLVSNPLLIPPAIGVIIKNTSLTGLFCKVEKESGMKITEILKNASHATTNEVCANIQHSIAHNPSAISNVGALLMAGILSRFAEVYQGILVQSLNDKTAPHIITWLQNIKYSEAQKESTIEYIFGRKDMNKPIGLVAIIAKSISTYENWKQLTNATMSLISNISDKNVAAYSIRAMITQIVIIMPNIKNKEGFEYFLCELTKKIKSMSQNKEGLFKFHMTNIDIRTLYLMLFNWQRTNSNTPSQNLEGHSRALMDIIIKESVDFECAADNAQSIINILSKEKYMIQQDKITNEFGVVSYDNYDEKNDRNIINFSTSQVFTQQNNFFIRCLIESIEYVNENQAKLGIIKCVFENTHYSNVSSNNISPQYSANNSPFIEATKSSNTFEILNISSSQQSLYSNKSSRKSSPGR